MTFFSLIKPALYAMQAFSLPARSPSLLIDDEFNAPTLDLPSLGWGFN